MWTISQWTAHDLQRTSGLMQEKYFNSFRNGIICSSIYQIRVIQRLIYSTNRDERIRYINTQMSKMQFNTKEEDMVRSRGWDTVEVRRASVRRPWIADVTASFNS